jgi:hypothetical protein
MFGVLLVMAAVLGGLFRWRLANAILLISLLILARFIGAGPLLAMALLASASTALGGFICRRCGWDNTVLFLICGVALLAGLTGWLLPFPVHYFGTYLILLGGLSWLGRANVVRVAKASWSGWQGAVDAAPWHAAFAMLALALAAVGLCPPSIQFDDMATHILLPEQLVAFGYYRMDLASQIWAAAPWASDVVQSYIALLCGHESRGATNLFWFCSITAGIWSLASELELRPSLRWMAVALYASLPIVTALNGSMQADTGITAVVVILTAIVVRISKTRDARLLFPFMLISGFALALKASQVLLVAPLALVAVAYSGIVPFSRQVLRGTVGALFIFGSSYFYALLITGNPLLPLYNGIFKSPFTTPDNFVDPSYRLGLTWKVLWDLSFHTDGYLAALPGGIGFSMLALSGCLLVTLGMKGIRWISVALIATALGLFLGIPYARYLVPLFPSMITLGLLAWNRTGWRGAGELILASIVLLNLLFIPTSLYIVGSDLHWTMLSHINSPPEVVKQDVQRRFTPESIMARHLRDTWPNGYSVYLSDPHRPYTAPFAGRAFASSWYDPSFQKASFVADDDVTGATWTGLFERTGMSHVVTDGTISIAMRASLAQMHATPELVVGDSVVGDSTLWRLCKENCATQSHNLIDARDISANVIWPKRLAESR